jgi:hypothetical protein
MLYKDRLNTVRHVEYEGTPPMVRNSGFEHRGVGREGAHANMAQGCGSHAGMVRELQMRGNEYIGLLLGDHAGMGRVRASGPLCHCIGRLGGDSKRRVVVCAVRAFGMENFWPAAALMKIHWPIVIFVIVLAIIVGLAAYGYFSGGWGHAPG